MERVARAQFAVGRPRVRTSRVSYFGLCCVFLLGGYAVFGRDFAYLGVPPIFVGEMGLALAVVTFLFRFDPRILRSTIAWLIALFMIWGAICTIPHIGTYGVNALRDAVIWGYAMYSLAVATIVLRFKLIPKIVELYGRSIPYFLVLALTLQIINLISGAVFDIKGGDLAVHYTGVIVFISLGLSVALFRLKWIILWMIGVGPSFLAGRGSMLTVAVSMAILGVLRPTRKFYVGIVLIVLALTILYVTDFSTNMISDRRDISVEQLVKNIQSIIGMGVEDGSDLLGTRQWREMWWSMIIDYTFSGQYFWTGKGFGISLADSDGFQIEEGTLRSPHNAHMTILARAGVPGFVLWVTLQVLFAARLLLNFLIDRSAKRDWLANVQLWTLLYWLAFLVNGSFDVFLEGPQGGIWFWCVFGFGLALIVARRDLIAADFDQRNSRIAPRPGRR
jgi:hypothetical protein